MRADTRIQLIAGAVLALCIAASGVLSVAVSAEAGRAQLGYADRAESSDPPEVAVAIALGAFRGLFVNILWFRAQELKQQGKFHEAIELSRTITRLQPRFPRVWGFHAWNMAYNISVATPTADERWQWVMAGVDLLKKEGIPRNPGDMLLHKELAWLFVHKIQGINDDANHYYKRRLARDWTYILGPPPPRADTREGSIERFAAKLQEIVDAPDTVAELVRLHPPAAELVRRLRDEAKLPLDMALLRRFELERAVFMARRDEGVALQLGDEDRNEAFEAILAGAFADAAVGDALAVLMNHVRKRVLIDEQRMEPARMIRYTRLYGPLDWRHPASHGLYWATRGVEEGLQRRNTLDFDQTNTDRVITHAVQELFRWGTVYFDPISDSYLQMIDLQSVDAYRVTLEMLQERATRFEDINRPFRLFGAGYENHLRDVIRIYYRMGDIETAERYYHELRTTPLKNTHAPVHQQHELSQPLAQFIRNDLEERVRSPDFAQTEIVASLTDAYLRGLLRGDMKVFASGMEYAAAVHENYMENQNVRTTADARTERLGSFMPKRFVDVAAQVLVHVLTSGDIGPWQASRMYRTIVGSPMRAVAQAAYERMAMLPNRPPNFAQAYPEPPGMDEYRRMREQWAREDDEARQGTLRFDRK